ncbi:unnamed protein product [Calypogeia fissa]
MNQSHQQPSVSTVMKLMEPNSRNGNSAAVQDVRWPMYVVAIRGTIASKTVDIWDDFMIGIEWVYKQPRIYEPVMNLLMEIHRKAPGPDGVWVTGHSLGAAVGLVATLRLAEEEGIVLPSHLFNCPYISPAVVARKVLKGTANGIAAGAKRVPFIGKLLGGLLRATGSAMNVLERIAEMAGEAMAPCTYAKATKRQEKLRLVGYCPHLYVNPKDPVCNEYIRYFQRDCSPVSVTVPFVQYFRSIASLVLPIDPECTCDSCHLIPRAFLHTNHWATGPYYSHNLEQWYLYDPDHLTFLEVKVGPEDPASHSVFRLEIDVDLEDPRLEIDVDLDPISNSDFKREVDVDLEDPACHSDFRLEVDVDLEDPANHGLAWLCGMLSIPWFGPLVQLFRHETERFQI